MDAYWLEQTEADVPAGNEWFSASEGSLLESMRFEKRRRDWRLGRWTAKRAMAAYVNLPSDIHSLREIEIRPAASGAPESFIFGQKTAVKLSLSHRGGRALCVIALGRKLGCDLELVESRDDSFIKDFFTVNEQEMVNRMPENRRSMLSTLLWSAKESALKALQVGLRMDTALLEVSSGSGASSALYSDQKDDAVWSPLLIRYIGTRILRGWWRCANDLVRTVVFTSCTDGK
jgi:4'-phosphopantetheinyl transferase